MGRPDRTATPVGGPHSRSAESAAGWAVDGMRRSLLTIENTRSHPHPPVRELFPIPTYRFVAGREHRLGSNPRLWRGFAQFAISYLLDMMKS